MICHEFSQISQYHNTIILLMDGFIMLSVLWIFKCFKFKISFQGYQRLHGIYQIFFDLYVCGSIVKLSNTEVFSKYTKKIICGYTAEP